jgi:hypothetical protein
VVKKDKTKNPMRDVRIRKLCLNICVGESGDRLTRAAKVREEDPVQIVQSLMMRFGQFTNYHGY